jgi:hypothetical protein
MNPLRRRVNGSLMSVTAGWSVVWLWLAYSALRPHRMRGAGDWWAFPLIVLIVSSVFVFGTWATIFLPLYLFVPRRSVFWRWPVCTACGAAVGAAIMFACCRLTSPQALDSWIYEIVAALVGGVTCLVASLSARHYDSLPAPNEPELSARLQDDLISR